MTVKLAHHYNRFKPQDNDESILYRAGRGLQSAELNEQQAILSHAIAKLGDALLSDGSVVSGGEVVINSDGKALCARLSIYLRGRVREVEEKTLSLNTTGAEEIGVWLSETVVTELEDPTLRDPAEGTRNYDEPGAGRLRVQAQWGLARDGQDGNFYKVYDVQDGALVLKKTPPTQSGFQSALARYDRDNNGGDYVISGMRVFYLSHDTQALHYSVLEGKAHVQGFEVEFPTARRLRLPFDPDVQTVLSEPHQFTPDHTGIMRIELNHQPIARIKQIDTTQESTATLTHGSYAGVADPLPEQAVIEILRVWQEGTTYRKDADYQLRAGQIDWSAGGQEPAPGSSYQVTFRHRKNAQPVGLDEKGFSLSGVVSGSLVLVDYEWYMPRVDTLTLDRDGNIHQIKGLPSVWHAKAIPAPSGQMEIARLHQTWWQQAPSQVTTTATVAVSMDTLQSMRRDIFALYDLVAIERLKSDAVASAPAAVRGVFVDPFLDDDLRDLGQNQSAAIIDGELCLPINTETLQLDDFVTPLTLPFEDEIIIEQLAQTGTMKVNPYAAFDPIPATATLIPPVDFWVEKKTINHAAQTQIFGTGSASRQSEQLQRQTKTQALEFLRPITLQFRIEGFRPDEELRTVMFDGIELEVNP